MLEDIRVTPDLVNNYKDGVLNISAKVKGTGKLNFILFDKEGKQVATATGLAKNGTANITMLRGESSQVECRDTLFIYPSGFPLKCAEEWQHASQQA